MTDQQNTAAVSDEDTAPQFSLQRIYVRGLPPEVLDALDGDHRLRLPMREGCRSLNLQHRGGRLMRPTAPASPFSTA